MVKTSHANKIPTKISHDNKGYDESTKTSNANKAYEIIRSNIFSGTLFQGYPLSEVDLAKTLGMSRTPVREALSQLRSQGLLEYIPRKGVVVKQFSKAEIVHAYEYTGALEGKLVSLLAEKAGLLDFSKAELSVKGMEKALKDNDIDAWVDFDDRFHSTLCDLCDNKFIVTSLESIKGRITYTRMLFTRVRLDKDRSTKDHRGTLDYIISGDAKKARDSMEDHLRRVQTEIMMLL